MYTLLPYYTIVNTWEVDTAFFWFLEGVGGWMQWALEIYNIIPNLVYSSEHICSQLRSQGHTIINY